MRDSQRTNRNQTRAMLMCRTSIVRHAMARMLLMAALALTTTSALALADVAQPKPQLSVEAERSPQGARLSFKGKGWAPAARIKITGTRAPGANGAQDFGMYSADSSGNLNGRKVVACSTTNMEDGSNEEVSVTAADSASGAKVTQRVQGGAWVCQ